MKILQLQNLQQNSISIKSHKNKQKIYDRICWDEIKNNPEAYRTHETDKVERFANIATSF